MKCFKCPFYEGGQFWNCCKLLGYECFRTCHDTDCIIVNDDGTVNQEEFDKIKDYLP